MNACPLCASEDLLTHEKSGKYTLRECRACGARFWDPLEHPGKEFYETSDLHEIQGKRSLQWRHKQFLKHPPLTGGKLLDVGCGPGEFLKEAQKIGFEPWGVDIAPRNVEAARNTYGLNNVYLGDLPDIVREHGAERFDVVTFFEIVEHLADPKAFIAMAKKLLKPGGYIVITVPNAERFGGLKEKEETPPNHLFQWRPRTLKHFLEAQGFSHVEVIEQPFSSEFFYVRKFFSFGIMKKIKERDNETKSAVSNASSGETSKPSRKRGALRKLAKLKNTLLVPVGAILSFPLALFGVKYWDSYAVGQLPGKNK
jgi:2-polyprenyl-3-methyl-5-hydroxy-6-metoxy-1,4-benzoquinol methylase